MKHRITVLGLLAASALAPATVLAAPAHAAWEPLVTIHGAKLQVCKEPLGNGRQRVKVRLDNRGGDHTHLGGISRTRGDKRQSVELRVRAGRISQVDSIVWRRGDALTGGIGETNGQGAGTDFTPGDVPRC
jgi:hypothetical protein